MGSYKVKGRGWRYHFQHEGKRYSQGFFTTKRQADTEEAEHRKRVEKESQMASTPSATGFKAAAYEYLDLIKRSQSAKTYKEKVFVYKSFHQHLVEQSARTADLQEDFDFPLPDIDGRLLESYLKTRPTNANWNKHRKNLCALFKWCFKRRFIDRSPCLYVDNLTAGDLRQKTIYTQEQIIKLLLASGELRPFLFAVYALAGRIGETNRLRWEDVNFTRREVILWTKKGNGSWREQKKHMTLRWIRFFWTRD